MSNERFRSLAIFATVALMLRAHMRRQKFSFAFRFNFSEQFRYGLQLLNRRFGRFV